MKYKLTENRARGGVIARQFKTQCALPLIGKEHNAK